MLTEGRFDYVNTNYKTVFFSCMLTGGRFDHVDVRAKTVSFPCIATSPCIIPCPNLAFISSYKIFPCNVRAETVLNPCCPCLSVLYTVFTRVCPCCFFLLGMSLLIMYLIICSCVLKGEFEGLCTFFKCAFNLRWHSFPNTRSHPGKKLLIVYLIKQAIFFGACPL